jgi:hypothetical protein
VTRRVDETEADWTCRMVLEVVAYFAEAVRVPPLESTGVTFDEDMKPYVEMTAAQRRRVA